MLKHTSVSIIQDGVTCHKYVWCGAAGLNEDEHLAAGARTHVVKSLKRTHNNFNGWIRINFKWVNLHTYVWK